MTGSYISRAMSSPACSARIPRMPVRYAVILCPESMVNFRCIKADVAMQQDIPSLTMDFNPIQSQRPFI